MLWKTTVATDLHFSSWRFGGKPSPGGSPLFRFLADSNTLVLLDDESHRLQLHDRATGKMRALSPTLNPAADYHWTVAPDGKTLLSVNRRDGLRAWDMPAGGKWRLLPLGGQEKARELAFSGDGKTLLLAGGGQLRVRDWPAGTLRRQIDLRGRSVAALLPGTDGRTAHVLLDYEKTLRHFNLDTGAEKTPARDGHRGGVSTFALGPGGKLVSAGDDGSVQVWDLRRGRLAHTFRPKTGCIFMTLSDDGKRVAAVDWEQTAIAIHECDTGRLMRTIQTKEPLRHLRFVPRSRLLLAGEGIPAWVFRVWDTETGRQVRRLEGEVSWHPVFSPDGRLLAAPGEKGVLRVIDFARGKDRFSLPGAGGHWLAFSPDGRTLASGNGDALTLWDVAGQKQRGRIKLNGKGCTALQFSTDGRWLAWGEEERIQLWDLGKGRLLHTFRGHEGLVTHLRFTPEGRALVSASTDSTLLVWDLAAAR
jgi:WD40 repeat protein